MRRAFAAVGAAFLLAACMVVWASAAGQRGKSDDSQTSRAFRDIIGTVEILGCFDASGIEVYIPGESFFVRTGPTGAFRLNEVPTGTYDVVIAPPGQDPVVLAGVMVGPPSHVTDLQVLSLANDGFCDPAPPPPPTCDPGLTDCGGICVDLNTDPLNCQDCGFDCGPGFLCADAICQVDPSQCQQGETACGPSCVDISSDTLNCGACNIVCAAGASCTNGACLCGPGQVNCGGACADLSNDPNNCGVCGVACGAGQACVNGVCDGGGCIPSCAGFQCGGDGCGGVCGICTGQQNICDATTQQCVAPED